MPTKRGSSERPIIEDFRLKNNIFLATNENVYRRLKSKLNFRAEDVKIWIALFQESSNSHLPCIIYTPEETARENLHDRLAYFLNSARIPSDKGLVGQAFTAKENKKNEPKNFIFSVYENEKNSISVVDFILDNRWWLAVPFPRENPRMVFSLTNSNYNDGENPWDETQLREVELILKDYEPEYLLLREKVLFHNSISAIEREIKQDFNEISESTVCNFVSGLSKELLKHVYLDYEAGGLVSTYYNTDLLEHMIASERDITCSSKKCTSRNAPLFECLGNKTCGLQDDALSSVFKDLETRTMILNPGPSSHKLRLYINWIPNLDSDQSSDNKNIHDDASIENFKLGLCCEKGCLTCEILCKEIPYLFIAIDKVVSAMEITTERWNSEWDFLLISDDIGNLIDCLSFFDKNILVMYHGYPDKSKAKIESSNCYVFQQVAHEKNDNYFELKHLVLAYDVETDGFRQDGYDLAISNIYLWFGVDMELELKLELLHACLTPAGAKKANESDLPSEIGVQDKVISLEGMNDPFSKKYLERLSEIRDQLLPAKN